MKTYAQKYLPLIIGAALAIGVLLGGLLNFGGSTKNPLSSNAKKEKLNRLIDYIDYEYVDSVNTDSIVDVTVNSILTKSRSAFYLYSQKRLRRCWPKI